MRELNKERKEYSGRTGNTNDHLIVYMKPMIEEAS